MVFGTLSPDAPQFETWLGPEIAARLRRVLATGKLEIIGRFTQALPNNWKLYSRTCATPTMPVCCTCSSPPSGSPG